MEFISERLPKTDEKILLSDDLWQFDNKTSVGDSKIDALSEMKKTLAHTKNKLDVAFKKPKFDQYWRELDPFKYEKYIIEELANTKFVTNAWLKCYEMLTYYDLMNNDKSFLHFDNAAFPGAFILATNHFIKTKNTRADKKYNWVASSLLAANEQDSKPLEDKYKLYENYPDKWLMNSDNNGDVLIKSNILDWRNRTKHAVTLYTSDLGFDVSNDFNNQELLQCNANIGQILSGLLTLDAGGNMITKQYTFFEPVTIGLMHMLSGLFDEFYVCKPITSRQANSETYLVGKNFLGSNTKISVDNITEHAFTRSMFDCLETKKLPIYKCSTFSEEFVNSVTHASTKIFNKQIEKINMDLSIIQSVYDIIGKQRANGKVYIPRFQPLIVQQKNKFNDSLQKWHMSNEILPIHHIDELIF
jgi:hypothetical protein